MITAKDLHIGYKNKAISKSLTLEIKEGDFISLLGPNGCGKSTLIKSLCGLIYSISGSIRINENTIEELSSKQRARLLSVVLTGKQSRGNLTVSEFIYMGRTPYVGWWGRYSSDDQAHVSKALKQCELEHLSQKMVFEISDGEYQRMLIAQALVQDTPFILLDEPTSHLDLTHRIEILALLKQLAQQGKGIMMSTHDLHHSIQVAEEIWIMNSEGDMHKGIPEDCLLEGVFEKYFNLSLEKYDFGKGLLLTNNPNLTAIKVQGQGQRLEWTIHALKRVGHIISDSSNIVIEIKKERWLLTIDNGQRSFDNLKSLLQALQ